jgi:membrane protease YdiL (CAAX protease family)
LTNRAKSPIDPLPSEGPLEETPKPLASSAVDPKMQILAGAFLAVNVFVAYLSAEGRGEDVVLVELAVVALLIGAAVRAGPVTGAWIPALVAVGVVVMVPFMLPLPTLGVGPRTAACGGVQVLAVLAVARRSGSVRPPDAGAASVGASPVRATPWLAWPVALLIGAGLGVAAHLLILPGSTDRAFPDFWAMGGGDRASDLLGVIVVGVIVEETLFRHILAPRSRAVLGRWSIVFDGALYATFYGASQSAEWCLVVLVAGTLGAWYRLRYGRLGPVVVAHALASTLAFVVVR